MLVKVLDLSETFSVHRVAYGEGMERVFMLHSPRIAKIEVMKEGDVRRSKALLFTWNFRKSIKSEGTFWTTSLNDSNMNDAEEKASS